MWFEVVCFFVVCLIVFTYRVRLHCQRKLGKIPIVSKIPIVGSSLILLSFRPENLHEKFKIFVAKYGKTFCSEMFGLLMIVTAEPQYVEKLLGSQEHIRKSMVYLMLNEWLGSGLLLSSGSTWQKMRKVITPTFHFKILEEFVDVFDRKTDIFIKRLREFADFETVLDIYPHMGLLTLDIIAETAMGVSINAQSDAKSDFVQAVKDVTNILATRFIRSHLTLTFFFRIFSPGYYKKQKEGIKIMHEFTENIIKERRNALKEKVKQIDLIEEESEDIGTKKRHALLDVLLLTTVDGEPLEDKQIRDEVNTFMFEGHDTTTSATSFALYLLSRNPKSQKKLFNEIRAHFGDDPTTPVTYSDLSNLSYLNCVVKESLRMYPPIPAIARWLKTDLDFGDTTFPANSNVVILLWQLLRDPNIFEEPELFKPERHLESSTNMNAFNNIPFSAGPRNCIGQRFALFEMKTIIVKMLRNYELIQGGASVHPSIKIVLRSKTGVNFFIKNRIY